MYRMHLLAGSNIFGLQKGQVAVSAFGSGQACHTTVVIAHCPTQFLDATLVHHHRCAVCSHVLTLFHCPGTARLFLTLAFCPHPCFLEVSSSGTVDSGRLLAD